MNMVEEPHLADSPSLTLDKDAFDAVILDLDGVVTQTAAVHAITWKATFDPLLQAQAVTSGTDFLPFDADTDYRRYVDGD
ncbi:MAG: hypothetical protein K0A99_09680 [Desulfoarculaceae bacterium]|nr:hypothetical protein [Desulfoarculaceae bacterium]